MPVPVGSAAAHLLGLWVRIFARAWMCVSCECWVLLIPGVQTCSYPTAKHVYKYGKVHKHRNVHLLFEFVSPDIKKITNKFQEIPWHTCKYAEFILLRVPVDYVKDLRFSIELYHIIFSTWSKKTHNNNNNNNNNITQRETERRQ